MHAKCRASGIRGNHPAGELFGCRAAALPRVVFRVFVSFVSFVVQPDCRFQAYLTTQHVVRDSNWRGFELALLSAAAWVQMADGQINL